MKQKTQIEKKEHAQLVNIAEKITTIHGTSYFTVLQGSPLTLWITILLGNVVLTIAFVIVIKDKFNANQIVTQVLVMLYFYNILADARGFLAWMLVIANAKSL